MRKKRSRLRKDSKVAAVSLLTSLNFYVPFLAQSLSKSHKRSVSSRILSTTTYFPQIWASQKAGNLILYSPYDLGLFVAADSFGVVCSATNKMNGPCHASRSPAPSVMCISCAAALLCALCVNRQ